MLKGKQLYEVARKFAEEDLVPALNGNEVDEEATDAILEKAAELGIALLIDIAESLHGIKAKVG
jgi:hypothetical protein